MFVCSRKKLKEKKTGEIEIKKKVMVQNKQMKFKYSIKNIRLTTEFSK